MPLNKLAKLSLPPLSYSEDAGTKGDSPHTNGQQAHRKMLSITSHQKNVNQKNTKDAAAYPSG